MVKQQQHPSSAGWVTWLEKLAGSLPYPQVVDSARRQRVPAQVDNVLGRHDRLNCQERRRIITAMQQKRILMAAHGDISKHVRTVSRIH